MAINRWSGKKLNQLADLVEALAIQVQQLQGQVSQLGQQVERTCERVDQLTEAMRQALPVDSARPTQTGSEHFAKLETKLEQLDRRVKALERQTIMATPLPQPAVAASLDEDEIEDEPDEILWDFLDPAERGR